MGRVSSQVRQSDVVLWGTAAMVCGALAVLSANIAAFVPENFLTGLHATRLQGGSFNQMRAQMTELRGETSRVSQDYRTLMTRFNLLDDDSGEVVRRLAAVERSLPLLIEALPLDSDIDRSVLTASIAAAGAEVYEADGGTIAIRRSALFPEAEAGMPGEQPMPPRITGAVREDAVAPPVQPAAPETQGIAIGLPGTVDSAVAQWETVMAQAGPLLLGTAPLLMETPGDAATRAVAGPLPDIAAAETLCTRLVRVGIACEPVPYEGLSWPR